MSHTSDSFSFLRDMIDMLSSTVEIRTTQVDDVDTICEKYTGNDNGDEPDEIGSGSDSTVSFRRI